LSIEDFSISNLDSDEFFWLKVCRSPDLICEYTKRALYNSVKRSTLGSDVLNVTFVAQFNDEKMLIYIWRIGR